MLISNPSPLSRRTASHPHRFLYAIMQAPRVVRRLLGMMNALRSWSSAAAAAAGCPFHNPGNVSLPEPAETGDALPFECVPTANGLPIIGTAIDLIMSGGAAKIHEYCDMRHKEMGPIFREQLGTMDVVVISDKDYIQKVYSAEGKYPKHLVPEPWVIYNNRKGIKRGLFFMDGEHWKSRRKLLNTILMSTKVIKEHGETFNEVAVDVLVRWDTLVEQNDGIVPTLEDELYNWSIESLGAMVFGTRLGCINASDSDGEMHEFVHSVQQIFVESAKMAIVPPGIASRFRLPIWNRFVEAADAAIEYARKCVEKRIREIKELEDAGLDVDGLLPEMLKVKNITYDEVVSIVADLILAAADTTSHATQWALYSLARNPSCQDRLLEEIMAVCDPGEELTVDHMRQIPYVNGIIKESLRMYPIASFLTRQLPKSIRLGQYEIPAEKMIFMSQYTVGRDPVRFPEPDKFMPERWERSRDADEGQNRAETSHACLPFGFGKRSCIGRTVAELKMQLLLTKTVQKFRLESVNEEEVGIALRMITTPDRPIKIRFHKRSY